MKNYVYLFILILKIVTLRMIFRQSNKLSNDDFCLKSDNTLSVKAIATTGV